MKKVFLAVIFVFGAMSCFQLQAYAQPNNQPSPPGFQHRCMFSGLICEFLTDSYPGHFRDFTCNDGTWLKERKFVCVSGPKKGQGFDVWCRVGGTGDDPVDDNKCNTSAADACPGSQGLTQWTVRDHCTHAGPGYATGNWTLLSGMDSGPRCTNARHKRWGFS
jgi:hypothetical protein